MYIYRWVYVYNITEYKHVHAGLLGQAIGSIHLPSSTISPSGQKQPSAQPLGQLEVSGLSHVWTHSEPHC